LRILILGSEGFIGGHCVSYFTAQGDTVFGLDLFERPSREYRYRKVSRLSPELEELFAQETFDAVVNASGSGNVSYSMTHPVIDFEANSLDTIRVLDTIRKYQPACRYIHISSAAVYGNPKQLPVREDASLAPMSPYGWHKLISEQLCQEYSSIYSLRIAIVRPFSVYGPGLRKQLFWDLHTKIKAASNNSIELFGTGSESRDFIHVRDLVAAIHLILEKGALRGEVYNAAAGIETTIREVVGIFVSALNSPVHYTFNGETRSGDPLNWKSSIAKLGALGFNTRYSLPQGLQEVATWLTQDSTHS
jgi:nucleoside-diphosphate-sugar epimerase